LRWWGAAARNSWWYKVDFATGPPAAVSVRSPAATLVRCPRRLRSGAFPGGGFPSLPLSDSRPPRFAAARRSTGRRSGFWIGSPSFPHARRGWWWPEPLVRRGAKVLSFPTDRPAAFAANLETRRETYLP